MLPIIILRRCFSTHQVSAFVSLLNDLCNEIIRAVIDMIEVKDIGKQF
jgi:hypothetical protein